jgi:hypothetical protein
MKHAELPPVPIPPGTPLRLPAWFYRHFILLYTVCAWTGIIGLAVTFCGCTQAPAPLYTGPHNEDSAGYHRHPPAPIWPAVHSLRAE